jgi:hypothetical protein
MSKRARGSCLCGAVRFELTLPSRFCAHCHCQNCRRAHGAAFVTWAGFEREQVEVSGAESLARYKTDTGATRSFCSRCGSTLFYEGPRWPEQVHVALANVADPIGREPAVHVYVDHRADWWEITDSLPRRGGKTVGEPTE